MAAATKHQIRIYVGGTLGRIVGTPGTAIIETGEVEGTTGKNSFVSGVKPLVDATTGAVTVAVGYRSDLQSSPTYTSETSANSRTGFCDFRNVAKYQRVRVTYTATFNAAQGIEHRAFPSGI